MIFSLYDIVVLDSDLPHQGLKAGAVGRIIEFNGPALFEVDFGEQEGSVLASQITKAPSTGESRLPRPRTVPAGKQTSGL